MRRGGFRPLAFREVRVSVGNAASVEKGLEGLKILVVDDSKNPLNLFVALRVNVR